MEENSILDRAAERIRAAREVASFDTETPAATVVTPSVTPVDASLVQPHETNPTPEAAPVAPAGSKHDWL
jgi:hypothetical protein